MRRREPDGERTARLGTKGSLFHKYVTCCCVACGGHVRRLPMAVTREAVTHDCRVSRIGLYDSRLVAHSGSRIL
eukprot:5662470-Pyramimonas_sp.AAC.1